MRDFQGEMWLAGRNRGVTSGGVEAGSPPSSYAAFHYGHEA